ncbi:TonB-dependent siderophore receptor [Methylosarcina fibrata]|uniref:TonB-dependent siderophore receptor n=1 Tax=Methylosarcina fibrata TaxID=105972 RepID=UPI0003A42259|nr:TonB-dependent receptor [Methylosarcina fibrata]
MAHILFRPHPRLLSAPLALVAITTSPVMIAEERALVFDIPPQALGTALNAFADAANVQLSYPGELAAGLKSPGVSGRYTPEQALQRLLAGTPISARKTPNGTVTLEKAQSTTAPRSGAETMPAVTVTGTSEYDTTDPYNRDYSLPNATTATKTDTPIMETPYSIQVVPKQVLKDQQIVRVNDALDNVSGVYRGQSSGGIFEQFILRGFGMDGGIVAYRDGYPFGNQFISSGRETANLERIEVLKGPASILYGQSEPGGIINYVTKKPLSNPYYSLQQQFGSFDFYRTTADATGPLTKDGSLLYRLNFAYEDVGTFKNTGNRGDRVFVAPVLQWNISDRTQVNLELEHRQGDIQFDPGTVAINGQVGKIPGDRFLGHPIMTSFEDTLVGLNWSHAFNDRWTFRHRFNAYLKSSNEFSPTGNALASNGDLTLTAAFIPNDREIYFNSVDLTGKFSTFGLDHTLLLGGDYYRNSANFDIGGGSATLNIFNPVYLNEDQLRASISNPFSFTVSNHNDWFGLFLQDQIKLPYHFHMLAGFRYDSMESNSAFNGSPTEVPRQDRLTPRGGLVWQPIPELSVYGSYSENVQAVSGTAVGGVPLEPESAQQWEAGLKTELFNQKFIASLAWFDLTKQNIAAADPANPGFNIPIGEAHSKGLEIDLKGEVLPGLSLIGAYAFTPEANVTKANDSSYPPIGRLRNVPVHGGSLWANYEFQEGDLRGLKFGSGVVIRSESEADVDNTVQLPGYATVNLMGGYGWKVGHSKVSLQLNVNNLLDKDYFPSAFSKYRIEVGQPRTFLGSVKIEF